MASTTSIFIQGNFSISKLVNYLELMVGHPFLRSENAEWELFETDVLLVHLSVFANRDFVNDQGIEFEGFSYVVDIQGCTLLEYNHYSDELLTDIPLALAQAVSEELNVKCIVVKNFQHVIETFEGKNQIKQ